METDYSKYRLSKKEMCGFFMGGYMILFIVTYLFYRSLFFSLAAGGTVFLCITPFEKWKADKRRGLLITQFKDLLYAMSSYVAANIQINQALEGSLESLRMLYSDDSPMIVELEYMVRNIRENKESALRLLTDFAGRSGCEDIENFVQVYTACIVTGGDMEKAMKNTIEILMDKINIEREIRTLTAQKRLEGNIITAMPVIVIMLLNVFSPDYLSPLYATLGGRLLMTAALTGLTAAHLIMRKLTRIEV